MRPAAPGAAAARPAMSMADDAREAVFRLLCSRLGTAPCLHWVARGMGSDPLRLGGDPQHAKAWLPSLMATLPRAWRALPLQWHADAAPTLGQGWVTNSNTRHHNGHGTLGAVLQSPNEPRHLFVLTAGHVLAGQPGSAIGDACVLSQIDPPLQVVGWLANSAPVFDGATPAGRLDAALMQIPGDALPALAEHLMWPEGVAAVRPGDPVRLLTRHHQLPGKVVDDRFSTEVSSGAAGSYVLHDLLLCQVDAGTLPGDSGAAVWNDRAELVGLHIGQVAAGQAGNAAVLPIQRVLDWSGCQPLLHPSRRSVAPAAAAPAPLAGTPAVSAATVDVLARTLWGEARSEQDAGMRAVGHVVLNRAARPRWWGATAEQVCLKPWQFSCWNHNDPNRRKLLDATLADPEFAAAQVLARDLLTRPQADPTLGATHYHATSIRAPAWTAGATFTVQIGRHRFFRDVP